MSLGEPGPGGTSTSWEDRLIEAAALFLLVFTPLAYGTVEPWSEAIAELVVLGMGIVWAVRMLRDWEIRIELPPGWFPGALFLMLVLLQTISFPMEWTRAASPWTTSLHESAARHLGADAVFVPLSLDRHETWRQALKLVAVAIFFIVLYNTYRTRGQVRRALWTMVITGSAISLFGIVQRVTWNGRIYWIGPEAPAAANYTFGPYINRTHFAALVLIVVPMALGYVVFRSNASPATRSRSEGWSGRIRRWNSNSSRPSVLIPFLVVLMASAALTSGSRGGALALAAAVLAMLGLAKGRGTRRAFLHLAVFVGVIALAAFSIGADMLGHTLERLTEELDRSQESFRLRVWPDVLGLWHRAPVLGTGLGAFGASFATVRTLAYPVSVTHAESDWLQLLSETGALGLALVLAFGGAVIVALFGGYTLLSARRVSGGVVVAGLVIMLGVAAQGVANYNLSVMANLLCFAMSQVLALVVLSGDVQSPR